jgi:hypothetical protein
MPTRTHIKRLTPPRANLLAAVALLGAALVLAGCGGSSAPDVAHLSTAKSASSASSASGTSSADSTATPQQAAIAFAKCMRSSGVPSFPDPTAGGGFAFHTSAGMDRSSPLFKSAQAKCQKLMPQGPGSGPPPSPQTLARFLNTARCMRQHGVHDFPDPRTSAPPNPFGSGIAEMSDIEGVILLFPSTINQQAPIFTRAAATCAFPLHNH